MSAICKTIAIHSKSVQALVDYCEDKEKTNIGKKSQNQEGLQTEKDIENALGYAANPLKTFIGADDGHKQVLVSGVKCDPAMAPLEFKYMQEEYRANTNKTEVLEPIEVIDPRTGRTKTVQKKPVTAIHLIQSFKETGLDPQLVHQMGTELAERLGVQAVVCTHVNRDHLHNHIIINAYISEDRKWLDNLESRLQIREISDDIQREYGIPIVFEEPRKQLFVSHNRGMSYHEWQQEQEGLSWKGQMRQDISAISSIASNRAEYLSMMESYGYVVERATERSITFRCLENGKKIRDTTLGEEFSVEELFPMDPAMERQHIKYTYPKAVSVARYDWNGRRRSDLEMMIRKAIAMIQKIGNLFLRNGHHKTSSSTYKIKLLQEALDGIRKYGLEEIEDLDRNLDSVGAQLSHAKAVGNKVEQEKPLYEEIREAINIIENSRLVKTNIGDLHLHNYSTKEIREKRAKIAPASTSMKSRMAVVLAKHPEYKLNCKFDELTATETAAVIDFINGRTKERPAVVVTTSEYESRNIEKMMDSIYIKREGAMKEHYADKKPSDAAIKMAQKLLDEKGYTNVDISSLSQYDVMSIINCLGPNPFTVPLITDKQRELLNIALQAKGLVLNRETEYVTQDECRSLLRYINGQITKEPALLQPYIPPYEKDIQNLKEFMEKKGIESFVPIEKLSKSDFNKLYAYVVVYDHTPECLQNKEPITNDWRNKEFNKQNDRYKIERQVYLSQLRNAINTLRSLGYEVNPTSDLSEIKKEVADWDLEHENIVKQKEQLAITYRELMKIKQTITYTKNPSFVYGELYDPALDEEIKVTIREEKDEREEVVRDEGSEKKNEKPDRDV